MNEPLESLQRYYGPLDRVEPRVRRRTPPAFAPVAAALAAYLFLNWCALTPEAVPSRPVASPHLERQMADAGLVVEPSKSSMAQSGRRTT